MHDDLPLAVRQRLVLDGLCWIWTGKTRPDGYGVWRDIRVHRLAYSVIVGPIPDGLVLDHLCRNPACANPAHLEPVTNRTNILRGNGPTAVNARKTECPVGHPYTEANTYRYANGQRMCRACNRHRAWLRDHG